MGNSLTGMREEELHPGQEDPLCFGSASRFRDGGAVCY